MGRLRVLLAPIVSSETSRSWWRT